MKRLWISIVVTMLMSMVGSRAYAYDIAVENADGVTIYYSYINNVTELKVVSGQGNYRGDINIPEYVTFMNRTRKVTSIGKLAFCGCHGLTSVTIPNSVTTIGELAFASCDKLASVNIPNSVIIISEYMFEGCCSLTSLTIPNSVTTIAKSAFHNCYSLTSLTIPNSVTTIGENAFEGCRGLTSLTIPNSVTSISNGAFYQCSGLTSLTIPNSVTTIGSFAFRECSGLTSLTIPNSVTAIGGNAFGGIDIPYIFSLIENPFNISSSTFSKNTVNNATLYVPIGTIEKYKATEGWKDFPFIEEGTGESAPTTPQKCEKPTISYYNGKLSFNCATEGVDYQYSITDSDIKAGSSQEVQLVVTYNIRVYAIRAGYVNSNVATATLCWIDAEPKAEGIDNDIAQVMANAVLIQTEGGRITINGVNDGTNVSIYNTNGVLSGNTISQNGSASINTNLPIGSVAIIRIGDKSIKIIVR